LGKLLKQHQWFRLLVLLLGEKMRKFWADIIGQLWTLLGMFVAWIVLEGSAKTVVGWCIVVSLAIWAITFKVRDSDE
jgi:hypothetical protein